MRHTNCIVFVTHVWSPAIARHFDRLKREASPHADVYLAFQASGPVPEGFAPDIVVTADKMSRVMPDRYARCMARGMGLYNYIDLVFMTAFSDPVVAGYDHYWYLEMDVDFSGDWGTFFSRAVSYEGDFLAHSIRTKSNTPRFSHWNWYEQPEDATVEPLHALMCISRFSARLVQAIIAEHNRGVWGGIFENTHPTIAAHHGMQVAQLGGAGQFVPAERRGLHYHHKTFTFRPPRAYAYFGDAPKPFRYPDKLYHPVKTGWPLSKRIGANWQAALGRWAFYSPAMDRIIRTLGLLKAGHDGMPRSARKSLGRGVGG